LLNQRTLKTNVIYFHQTTAIVIFTKQYILSGQT